MSSSAKFHGVIRGGKFRPAYPEDMNRWFREREASQVYVSLSVFGGKRTKPQTAYFYAVVVESFYNACIDVGNDTIAFLGREIALTKELAADWLKTSFAPRKDVVNEQTGEIRSVPLRLSEMDKFQTIEFLDACINTLARDYGVVVPPPDPNWKSNLKPN